jgi:tyrosyl-tRNA synthetase
MYGKVMSIPDQAMLDYYRLVTRFGPAEIAQVERDLSGGAAHPMQIKMQLAREIVSTYHGDDAAAQAEAHFEQVVQRHDLPDEMPAYRPANAEANIVELVVDAGLARSKSQARRLIAQGGVRIDGQRVHEVERTVQIEGQVLQVGKRRFVRLVAG